MSDSLLEHTHAIAAQRLAVLIKRSADLADVKMTIEEAGAIRRELVKSLPDLLGIVAASSEGAVR